MCSHTPTNYCLGGRTGGNGAELINKQASPVPLIMLLVTVCCDAASQVYETDKLYRNNVWKLVRRIITAGEQLGTTILYMCCPYYICLVSCIVLSNQNNGRPNPSMSAHTLAMGKVYSLTVNNSILIVSFSIIIDVSINLELALVVSLT